PVDWQSDRGQLFLNPRMLIDEQQRLQAAFDSCLEARHCLGVATSGTTETSATKIVLLTREACLNSAQAVVDHLEIGLKDRWFHVLPDFHVGGLSIWARSQVAGCEVIQSDWNKETFVNQIEQCGATWASLVPTQIFDLVSLKVKAPRSLKGVLVGGGSLSDGLYLQARRLGWPLLPTYGMTECCSQIATASLSSLEQMTFPPLKVLRHVRVRVGEQECLQVASSSLFKGYLVLTSRENRFESPIEDGWFQTRDRVELTPDGCLVPIGRLDERVKVLGELVDLSYLQKITDESLRQKGGDVRVALTAVTDLRQGNRIVLVYEENTQPFDFFESLRQEINGKLLPFERISEISQVSRLPLTELGKVRHAELRRMLTEIALKSL
ncbi:MAG: AMP-binding protein, partial [Bdellovibrionales bacterium]|nr:AMP-binding protein [Bdellovibrionales bacterium]